MSRYAMSNASERDAYGMSQKPDEMERWLTLAGTGALAMYGFTRRSWPGLILSVLAGNTFLRCLNNPCSLGLCQDYPRFADQPADPIIEQNAQDEASWQSFPASDAPARRQITAY